MSVYYHGTLPLRRWVNQRALARGRAPVIVLFYHRVADDTPNDWTISNELFTWQVEWLAEHFDLVSLAEAQRRVAAGSNTRPAVSLTFDDGYADNCHHALPLLIKRRIPCTYFVTTRHVIEGRAFAHDVSAGQPLRPNSPAELRALAAAGIEIGAHTRTHPDLGTITDPAVLEEEIAYGREELQQLVQREVRHFAFPYGLHANLSEAAFHVARTAGYHAVCSAYGGYNLPGDDPFHLQRVHGDADRARFMNQLTVDPRKQFTVRRYVYGPVTPVAREVDVVCR
jgi:peptidoglycan/xylan/chitin deacetylase (PgdA/CDA1 family)